MRNIDQNLQAAVSGGEVSPVLFVDITFKSQTCYVSTLIGDYVAMGHTYTGIGSLAKVSAITEGVGVHADGAAIALSGIDPLIFGECMTDIQQGAPAKVWLGAFVNGFLMGNPYLLFSGSVDSPTFHVGADTCTIELSLENKMVDLSRPNMRRYTEADQHLKYPDDTAFNYLPALLDQALVWGQ